MKYNYNTRITHCGIIIIQYYTITAVNYYSSSDRMMIDDKIVSNRRLLCDVADEPV